MKTKFSLKNILYIGYMLLELEIRDFALIEHLAIPFTWGLNAFTGETGSGKSIILDALTVVLGGKANSTMIRQGANRAIIEATFKTTQEIASWLKHNEFSEYIENSHFTISREINLNGSNSKTRLNGILVNMNLLQELRSKLITIHTQHEMRTLFSPQTQLEMLDALADSEHKETLSILRTNYLHYKQLESELKLLESKIQDREQKLDFARFQLTELDNANIENPEEDILVEKQKRILSNLTQLEKLLANTQIYLKGNEFDSQKGSIELLEIALTEIQKAAELDPSLENTKNNLTDILDRLEDECRNVRKHAQTFDSDTETLSSLEERYAELSSIKRKYGPSLYDAISRKEQLNKEIEKLENAQIELMSIQKEIEKTKKTLSTLSEKLSSKRTKLANILSQKIVNELSDLGMTNCKFEICLTQTSKKDSENSTNNGSIELNLGPNGSDKIDFLISANPGQPLLPISKIASGGELSRIMLALKSIFAGSDHIPIIIFDEIDTGLSGKVLQSLRDKLAHLAKSHQILCITHQAIIASVADNHIFVSKEQKESSTRTNINILDESGRLRTLASMASGQENEQISIDFAKSLLAESLKLKGNINTLSSY